MGRSGSPAAPSEARQVDALILVLEGSLARICCCHEIALELVCGADFWCNRHGKTSPVNLEGFWGQVWQKIDRKPTQKFPARLPSGTHLPPEALFPVVDRRPSGAPGPGVLGPLTQARLWPGASQGQGGMGLGLAVHWAWA